ncbi:MULTISPECIES: hypothetical protein [Bacillaceae]|jgi:uncharacterized Zn finger protein|uniref:Uncharacterized protein n=1 Tax=Rossellomorea vietnamensis TaxID=218284 RepID=A0A6I6UU52_9BACI|nr:MULTISPECIES: hypothetical protein [Bacillaceae]QHE62256.1 hypothetical protein FHE72_15475 [Rossellomorea vietnamensis]
MLYEVKIWGKEFKCDVCSDNQWHKSTLKIEFQSEENGNEYNEEIRYMFECKKCGNCRIFGMVSNENDIDDVNISIRPISDM